MIMMMMTMMITIVIMIINRRKVPIPKMKGGGISRVPEQGSKNRQPMTACGYCCYFLEHCSKTNNTQMKANK